MKATERLYLTADRKEVVKEGDVKARFLLVAKGQEIPKVIAEQYGLKPKKAEKKKAEKPEDKKVDPPENKGSGVKINRLKDKKE